jgi:hypothetical protein
MKHTTLTNSSMLLGIALAPAAGLAMAPTATAATVTAKAPSWHVLTTVRGPSADFGAVVATGPASGWAFVDNSPYALERTGAARWKKVSFPGGNGEDVAVAEATSATDVWAFTNISATRSQAIELVHGKWTVRKTLAGYVNRASVLAAGDVWVFGSKGTYHYNGSTWAKVYGAVNGGDALSASDFWTYGAGTAGGTTVTHVKNGKRTTFNLARLLPAVSKDGLNDPQVAGVYAVSDSNVYVIGNGRAQDGGGPVVILHYNGHTWKKLAGYGQGNPLAGAPAGAGGLWIPVVWSGGSAILHYSGGKITAPALPAAGKDESLYAGQVSRIPGTADALAIANTQPYDGATRYYSEVLQYS